MKLTESDTETEDECACKKAGFIGHCQCQYPGWTEHENKHQSCDFCGLHPVVLSVNDDAWWICKKCADAHYGDVDDEEEEE